MFKVSNLYRRLLTYDYRMCVYMYTLIFLFSALPPPSAVNAVWISGMDIFHVCWMSTNSGPLQASSYRILSSDDSVLYKTVSLDNEEMAIDVTNTYDHRDFTIQALSESSLPSVPLSVYVSG